ncbi:MAG: efflux RND transporter periplasmic adaptor subunit [Syntrophales bacterium]|jgi:membrane fusion protein (multidrug efflux system)|nr:efflux RND transporter periplasmic adaptor subunit [Syntrophales bacterium]MCK9390172.1 efflux RND transporter periplasmic adaptor subunit [Syntrophales bacterium]
MKTASRCHAILVLFCIVLAVCHLPGCGKDQKGGAKRPPAEVTAVTITPKDTPVVFEWVGQTESSHLVEIRSRVEGFLDKRVYEEGSFVKAGQVLFRIDPRNFQAALQQANGELAQQQARWTTAKANLARIKPLADQNAVSKKDLDDATGNEQQAAASVLSAQGNVRIAELNLSYTVITSPVTGLSSQAKKQDGTYISATDSLLTYVAKMNPMWVTFSMSENEWLLSGEAVKKGTLRFPPEHKFAVELVLADGSIYPQQGHLIFADPSFSKETGTFLLKATMENPKGLLKPGQFVRVRLKGAIRPNAIVAPRRAVFEGAKGHFVWCVDKEGTAEVRNVTVGEWIGDDIFITKGLAANDRVLVDGVMMLAEGMPVKIVDKKAPAVAGNQPAVPAGKQTQSPSSGSPSPQSPAAAKTAPPAKK